MSEHAGGVRRLSCGGPESDLRPSMNEGSKALWDPSAAPDSEPGMTVFRHKKPK